MMRRIFILSAALLSLAAMPVAAQKIERVKSRLAAPQSGENGRSARVGVNESGSAGSAVRRGEAAASAQTANGFRIVIFFDNGSTARSEAERIMASFKAAYSDVHCDIRYENPYFKVLAGNCVTSEEAVILLGRVRSSFPEAYIMREEIPVQNFVSPKSLEINPVNSADGAGANAAGEM